LKRKKRKRKRKEKKPQEKENEDDDPESGWSIKHLKGRTTISYNMAKA